MNIGIIGTRFNGELCPKLMSSYLPENCTMIISGGAVGVDKCAVECAIINNIPYKEILPNYSFFGKQAPLVRNVSIVKESDKVIAFWDHKSRGTAHTIRECIRLKVPVEIVGIDCIVKN